VQNWITATVPASRIVTFGCLLVAVMALFAFSGKLDPDYDAYRLRYELGGGLFAAAARDPLFLLVSVTLSDYMTYQHFRYVLIAVFGVLLLKISARVAVLTPYVLGFVLFLTPFIILKLHVQVREGLALLLWMYAVTHPQGPRIKSFAFWLLAALSCAVHLSVAAWWAATIFLMLEKNPNRLLHAALFTIAFFLLGTFVINTAHVASFFADTFLHAYLTANATTFVLETPAAKARYWALFVLVPLCVLATCGRSLVWDRDRPSIIGTLGTYGLIGFSSAIVVRMLIGERPMESDFILAGRLGETMLIFLALRLGMTRPASIQALVVLAFATAHGLQQLVTHS
jgi:hypothetical protein